MILAACANLHLRVRAGDAASACLQADQCMESQDSRAHCVGPAELAVLFWAPPENPVTPVRVRPTRQGRGTTASPAHSVGSGGAR